MARNYPRFLFSDPKNVKGGGPYVVHLLEPRILFKVNKSFDNNFSLEPLDKLPSPDHAHQYELVFREATTWLHYQIKGGFINL